MSKKRKNKQQPSKWNPETSGISDYSDPKELERMTKFFFSRSKEKYAEISAGHPGSSGKMDMDAQRVRRRIAATCKYAPKVKELVHDVCPDIPEVFSIEEEWAQINSLPITSYDMQETNCFLMLGAAIWMLDRIKENGKISEAVNILPHNDAIYEDVVIPTVWDPVHHESIIRAMVYSLENRNADCMLPGQKKKRKQEDQERWFSDQYTVEGIQHQDVPSRNLFENLLALIPKDKIDKATANFENKLFEQVLCHYRCRRVYCKSEVEIERKRRQFESSSASKMQNMMEQMKSGAPAGSLPKFPLAAPELNPMRALSERTFSNDPLLYLHQMDAQYNEIADAVDDLGRDITRFTMFNHRLRTAPKARNERDFGSEIAAILEEYSFSDPYEVCFALLYLLDTDSDLPWLYYPGTILSEVAGSQLPWFVEDFDDMEDWHWSQYFDETYQGPAGQPKSGIEVADWYSLDYIYKENRRELDFQERSNLAQIIYESTGGILPRDLSRYQGNLKYLRDHGVTGKKMQLPLLYVMTILGEARYQTKDDLLEILYEPPKTSRKESAENEEVLQEQAPDSAAQLQALKQENDQLRRIAHAAEKTARDSQRERDELQRQFAAEHRELAQLREILFLRENELEPEEELDSEISLPYQVKQSTVVFGGHDSWARAIKPMLTGEIRFIDRGMRIDENLIRYADVIWIQANSLSHADYYKIIRAVRTVRATVHYFQYASAEKCARQLASIDGDEK